jgi:PAS domain S-box-containing protein
MAQVARNINGPGFPWMANMATAFTSMAAFWGLWRYGRVLSPRALYLRTVRLIPNGMVHIRAGRISWASRSMARLVGIDNPDELIGLSLEEVMITGEEGGKEMEDVRRRLCRGEVADREILLRGRKDRSVLCLVNSTPFDDADPDQGAIAVFTDISELNRVRGERERVIGKLQEAIAEVKKLGGLLPICAHCKKIRDDKGYWKQIESYIREHSEAEFSHSICPECMKELYPDLVGQKDTGPGKS